MDSISDLLTRIRNSAAVNKLQVPMPYSRFKASLLDVLQKEKFIKNYVVDSTTASYKMLNVELFEDKKLHLKKISKPGQRIYFAADDIKKVKNGYGISIISTSHGVMTGKEAFEKKIGGEMLCEVY
jgi:small subunit ribosomal protein S8